MAPSSYVRRGIIERTGSSIRFEWIGIPRIKLREGNQHASQGKSGPKIRVGVIHDEVDLFNLKDKTSHLGGKKSPPIDKMSEVFIGLHLLGDQVCKAWDVANSVGVFLKKSISHLREILYILDREGVIPFEGVSF